MQFTCKSRSQKYSKINYKELSSSIKSITKGGSKTMTFTAKNNKCNNLCSGKAIRGGCRHGFSCHVKITNCQDNRCTCTLDFICHPAHDTLLKNTEGENLDLDVLAETIGEISNGGDKTMSYKAKKGKCKKLCDLHELHKQCKNGFKCKVSKILTSAVCSSSKASSSFKSNCVI
jgi:hypothetical protein